MLLDSEDEDRDDTGSSERPRVSVGDVDEDAAEGDKSALRNDIPYVEVSAAFEPL